HGAILSRSQWLDPSIGVSRWSAPEEHGLCRERTTARPREETPDPFRRSSKTPTVLLLAERTVWDNGAVKGTGARAVAVVFGLLIAASSRSSASAPWPRSESIAVVP